MLSFAAVCTALVPRININSDLTQYLPKESRMREGLDSLRQAFPFIDTNAPKIKVMVAGTQGADSLGRQILEQYHLSMLMGTRQNDSLTLFEFTAPSLDSLEATTTSIKAELPCCIAVESNANGNMPANMIMILALGCLLIFLILFVMCSSFMEAILFIISIGVAVLMNMGTNALLPSVSMMTNTIVGVLQFVLSMDYSIILMNRYRMVRSEETDSAAAMSKALRLASSSILSSSFTTIVGLLVLVFMKFRIGMDLGIVLAKGVFFSLLSIYTILPALILVFEKAIFATQKKVPLFPTDRLAAKEIKYRWVLFPLFIILFFASFYLQKRTELSYASVWESEINDIFPSQNSFMLLFRTSDEDSIPALTDKLSEDGKVVTAVSYASVMKKEYTASQMFSQLSNLKTMMPEGMEIPIDSTLLSERNLELLYYAATHPRRNEKMSFEDILNLASDTMVRSMMPKGLDPDAIMAKFSQEDSDDERQEDAAATPDTTEVKTDSANAVSIDYTSSAADSLMAVQTETGRFRFEDLNRQMDSRELASYMDSGEKNTGIIFRMAGKKGQTMSPAEFIDFVNKSILPNRIMRMAISSRQLKELEEVSHIIDSTLAAGPESPSIAVAEGAVDIKPACADSLGTASTSEEIAVQTEIPEKQTIKEETAIDRLGIMALSGERYSADSLYRAFKAAELGIDRNTIDLMFLYYGARKHYDRNTTLSPERLVDFLCNDVAKGKLFRNFLPAGTAESLSGLKDLIYGSIGKLRGPVWSMAAIVTEYPVEADNTFAFVEKVQAECDRTIPGQHFLIGEPVMYKEMKDGFRKELLFLTFLTIAAIFFIVALTFRSLVIPVILIMSVMTGVFVNVFVSGMFGGKMLYLAYLIVQSILMGATIDYAILLTNFYLESRRCGNGKVNALRHAYKSSIHTIMTSGLIMVCAPYVMSLALTDPAISSILSSLTFGALSALIVIIFFLPATLAACDKLIVKTKKI